MDNLNYLKSSPTLQLLKQPDMPLAIAQKTAAFCDSLSHSSLKPAISESQVDRIGSLASMTSSFSTNQAAWVSQITATERAIEAMKRDWAREESLIDKVRKMTQAAYVPQVSVTEKVIEALKQDWAPLSTTMKLAQETWALEAKSLGVVVESWRLELAREYASLGTAWKTAQAAWRPDTAHIASALQPLKTQSLQIAPPWAASISLKKIETPRAVLYSTPQLQLPNNCLSRKPFSNYHMTESYDLLTDFERGLRDFIHQKMFDTFGSKWEKSRLPGEMYKRWREKAIRAGESAGPLIDYADFSDYVDIITRKDNWKQLFKSYFGRPQLVQESLYRLQPIRVCTMHSRILSQDMWLVLQTETLVLSNRMWD
jgi:hypothetical protein